MHVRRSASRNVFDLRFRGALVSVTTRSVAQAFPRRAWERGDEGSRMTTAEAPTSEAVSPPALRFLRSLSGPVIGLAVVLALFIALIGADASPGKLAKFLSVDNLQIIAHEATIPAIVALGMLLVIISGGIDLSVGSVVALAAGVRMRV